MPFTKIGNGRYSSPSGRTYNAAQVRLYYSGTQPGFRPSDDPGTPSPQSKPSNPLIDAYRRIAGTRKLPVGQRSSGLASGVM